MTQALPPSPIQSEAGIIQGYLAPLAAGYPGAFGLADDAAAITPPQGYDLIVTMDAVAAGVHFSPADPSADIGWKALAVNVSDLVAKGATPHAYLMSLAFPEPPDAAWLAAFAGGLDEAQRAFGITLIGGDTDRRPGPLSVTITAIGIIPAGRMVARGAARAGDRILVSGTLGDSALGLRLRAQNAAGWRLDGAQRAHLEERYLRPNPPLGLAPLLRDHASAAMDVSDGLIKDLARMAAASGLAAHIKADRLPLSDAATAILAQDASALALIATGGDDYEVLVALPPDAVVEFCARAAKCGIQISDIGCFSAGAGVVLLDALGHPVTVGRTGYDHF